MNTKMTKQLMSAMVFMLQQFPAKFSIRTENQQYVIIKGDYDVGLHTQFLTTIWDIFELNLSENDSKEQTINECIKVANLSGVTFEITVDTLFKTKGTQSIQLPTEKVAKYLQFLADVYVADSVDKKVALYSKYHNDILALNENEILYFNHGLPLEIHTLANLNFKPYVIAMYELKPKSVCLARIFPDVIKLSFNRKRKLDSFFLQGESQNPEFSRPLYPYQVLCTIQSKDIMEKYN